MAAIFDQFGNYAGDDGMGDNTPAPKPAMDPEVARLLARYPAPNFYNRPLVGDMSPRQMVGNAIKKGFEVRDTLRDAGKIGLMVHPATAQYAAAVPMALAQGEMVLGAAQRYGAEKMYELAGDEENAARIAQQKSPEFASLMQKYYKPLMATSPSGKAIQEPALKFLAENIPVVPSGPKGSGFAPSPPTSRPLLTPNDARAVLGEASLAASEARQIPTDISNYYRSGVTRMNPVTNKPSVGSKIAKVTEAPVKGAAEVVQNRIMEGKGLVPGLPEEFQTPVARFAVKPSGGNFPTTLGATKTIDELSATSPVYSHLHSVAPDLNYTPVSEIPGLGKTHFIEWKQNVLDSGQRNAFDEFLGQEVKNESKPLEEWIQKYPALIEQPEVQKLQNTPGLPAKIDFYDLPKDVKNVILNSASDAFTKQWNAEHADSPFAQIPGSSLDVGRVIEDYYGWITKGPYLNYITKQMGTGTKNDPFVKAAEKDVFVGDRDFVTDSSYYSRAQDRGENERQYAVSTHSADTLAKNPEIGTQTATTPLGQKVENMSDASITSSHWDDDRVRAQEPPSIALENVPGYGQRWVSRRGNNSTDVKASAFLDEADAQAWHNELLKDEGYTGPDYPYMSKVPDDVPIYDINDRYVDKFGLENVRKNVFRSLLKGEIAPEDLKKVDMTAAINLTHKQQKAEEKARQNSKKAYGDWRYNRVQEYPASVVFTNPVGITPAGSRVVVFDKAFIDANPDMYIRDFSVLTKDLNFCLARGGHGTPDYPGHAPLVEPHTGLVPRGNDTTSSGYIDEAVAGREMFPAVYAPDGSAQGAMQVRLHSPNPDDIQQDVKRYLLNNGMNQINALPVGVQRFIQTGMGWRTAVAEMPELQKLMDDKTTYKIDQIKGENNSRIDPRFEAPIRAWLNQNKDKLDGNVNDKHNLPNTVDLGESHQRDAVKFNPLFDHHAVDDLMTEVADEARREAQMDLVTYIDNAGDPNLVPPGEDFQDWIHEVVGEALGNDSKNTFMAALDPAKLTDQLSKDIDKVWNIYRNRRNEALISGLGDKRFIGEEDVLEAARQYGMPMSTLAPPLKTDAELAQMTPQELNSELKRARDIYDRAYQINTNQKEGFKNVHDANSFSKYADKVKDAWVESRIRDFSTDDAAGKLLDYAKGHDGNPDVDSLQNVIDRLTNNTSTGRLFEVSGMDVLPQQSVAQQTKFNQIRDQVLEKLHAALAEEKSRLLTEPSSVEMRRKARDVLDQIHEHFDRLQNAPPGTRFYDSPDYRNNTSIQGIINKYENDPVVRALIAPLSRTEGYLVAKAFTAGENIKVPEFIDVPVTRQLAYDAPQETVGEVGERRMSSQFVASMDTGERTQQYLTSIWDDIRNSDEYRNAATDTARYQAVKDGAFKNLQALNEGFRTPTQMGLTRNGYLHLQDKLTDALANMENAIRDARTREMVGQDNPYPVEPQDIQQSFDNLTTRLETGQIDADSLRHYAYSLRNNGGVQHLHREMGQNENDMFNLATELEQYVERYEREAGQQFAFDPQTAADDLLTQDVHPDGRMNLTAVHDTMYALVNGELDYPGFREHGMNADENLQAQREVVWLMAQRLIQQGHPIPDFMEGRIPPEGYNELPAPPAEINVDDLNLFEPDPGHPANAPALPARQNATPEQNDLLDRLHNTYLAQLRDPAQAQLFFNDFMAQFPQMQGQERAVMNLIEIKVEELRDAQEQLRQNPEGLARGGLVRPLLRNPQLANLAYRYNAYLH